jgi:hypothetical protein
MVGSAFKRDVMLNQSIEGDSQGGSGWVEDRDVVEASARRRGRTSSFTFPGVQANVVVIATSGKERRAVSHPLHDFKA